MGDPRRMPVIDRQMGATFGMHGIFDRRRFMCGAASVVAIGALPGCGGSTGGQGEVISPTPTPTPTPTPSATAPGASPPPTKSVVTIAVGGSSSAAQFLSFYDGPAANAAVTASSDGEQFATLRYGAFGKTAGALIVRETGKSVRFLRGGVGATTLVQWAAAVSPQRAAFVHMIRAAGGADAVLLHVGRNDVSSLLVGSVAVQIELLRSLIATLRAEAGIPDAMIFIGGSQDIQNPSAEQRRQIARQRLTEIGVATTDRNVRYGYSTYDLATVDGVHQSESGQVICGTRFGGQVAAWLQNGREQRGPRIVSVAKVSDTQTDVEFALSAGTDIMPRDAIDGFQAFSGADDAELPISAAERTGARRVRLTHAARSGRAIRIGYALGAEMSDTQCLRDNSESQLPAEPFLSEPI